MEEKTGDLFGRLPNEIICHIISFLPSESALETSLISSRWRGLWNTALVQHVSKDDVPEAVAEFLSHFDKLDPLRHPRRLKLYFGKGSDLLLATISANNKLHLEFSTGKDKEEFPPRYFGLQLQLKYDQNVQNLITHQPCSSTFFVKTLYLKSVINVVNEEVSSMFSSFQFLENLKIIECDGLQSLHIESSPKLLSLTNFDCHQLESLHLRTSKLRTFHYRGFLPRIWPEHHFNLADAMLDFRLGPGYTGFSSSDFDPMLLTIKNAQVLTLCRWTFQNDPESYCITSTAATPKKVVKSHTKLGHLKVIKFEGFTNKEAQTTLAEHIKEVISVQPLIIATLSDKNCLRNQIN